MEDVRKAAQSRAARMDRPPLGTSFESERRHSKNALIKQISSLDGKMSSTNHRQGFLKLMKDDMEGKIDMIITKAVFRFARNLIDCIGWKYQLFTSFATFFPGKLKMPVVNYNCRKTKSTNSRSSHSRRSRRFESCRCLNDIVVKRSITAKKCALYSARQLNWQSA